MKRFLFVIYVGIWFAFWHSPNLAQQAQSPVVSGAQMDAQLVASHSTIAAGEEFWIGVRLIPADGWHFYFENPGDTGLPTRIDWTSDTDIETSAIHWPVPARADYQGFVNYGYYGETILLTKAKLTAPRQNGQPIQISANVAWLICEEICIPGQARLEMNLEEGAASTPSDWSQVLAGAVAALPLEAGTLAGHYDLQGGFQVVAELPAGYADATPLDLIPVSTRLVNNTRPPVLSLEGGQLTALFETAARAAALPTEFVGVLLVELEGQVRAVRFDVLPAAGLSLDGSSGSGGTALWLVLLLALLGGLTLNLMPCVLPVLSLKVMHLLESPDSTSHRHIQGVAYTAGVIVSFVLFAAALIGLRAAGEQIGWGFQLQSPAFVAVLALVIFALALSLSGFIHFGVGLTRLGSVGHSSRNPVAGSFATGVLAVIVATPCTAPFMGVAMGAAMTMHPLLAMLIFVFLGIGLALPFLLIAFIPGASNWLPRPGAWMERIKEVLAFPLYFTAVWLLWVFSKQVGADGMAVLMTAAVVLVIGLWIWRQTQLSDALAPRLAAGALVILGFVLAISAGNVSDDPNADAFERVPYSVSALAAATTNGQPVFVNMTADWCITCKVNERVALANAQVLEFFATSGVIYMEGDWTHADAEITAYLQQFERNGVPLYVVYPAGGGSPRVLPQILTPSIVVAAFEG